jgi:phage-related protein
VKRKWRPFDERIIRTEFRKLASNDWFRLTAAMRAYAKDLGIGYEVKSYGGGLMMVKDSGAQGRCLFFTVRKDYDGSETLTALLIYKKESQEAPERIIELAKKRMRDTK